MGVRTHLARRVWATAVGHLWVTLARLLCCAFLVREGCNQICMLAAHSKTIALKFFWKFPSPPKIHRSFLVAPLSDFFNFKICFLQVLSPIFFDNCNHPQNLC